MPYNRAVSMPGPAEDTGSPFALAVGTLIDGRGGPPVPDVIILIQAGRIGAVGPAVALGALDVPVLDFRRQVLLPGLIDVHASTLPSDRHNWRLVYVDPDEMLALTAVHQLTATSAPA